MGERRTRADLEQLAPMAKAAKEALEVETLDAGADAGYHNGVEVVECEANGITPWVPKPKTSSRNEKKGLYTKESFTYSAEQDAYQCPAGQWLGFSTQTEQEDGRTLRYYANWPACAACPLRPGARKASRDDGSCARRKRRGWRRWRGGWRRSPG